MTVANEAPSKATRADIALGSSSVDFLDPVEAAAIEKPWTELESRSDASFFQSWGWISCWLAALPRERLPMAAIVSGPNKTVIGLALLGRHRKFRHGALPSSGYFLHETGDARFDSLTIEYNGVLAERASLGAVTDAFIAALVRRFRNWDELFLSGIALEQEAAAAAAALANRLVHRRLYEKPCRYVDLDKVRQSGDYLENLGRNTRYQVRRALRMYQEDGSVTFENATSADEALLFLDGLKELHQSYWRARGQQGAFANAFFEEFHRLLIRQRFSAGEIQLAKVSSPKLVIGYLYNFVFRGTVYAYQSGFHYDEDGKRKPGLVSHYLSIDHHLRTGARIYDFMAGDGQHKQNLSTDVRSLVWSVDQRPRLKFRLEDLLRQLKHRVAYP